MHASLQSILRLYREPLPEDTPPAHEDAEAVVALAAVRDALDARTETAGRARPDAFVLDQILAAASHGAPVGPPESLGLRFDRQSVPRRHARFRRALAFALTGSLAALSALFVLLPGSERAAPAPEAAPAAALEAPTLALAAPTETSTLDVPAAPAPAAPKAAPIPTAPQAARPTAAPARPTAAPAPAVTPAAQAAPKAAQAVAAEARAWETPRTDAAVADLHVRTKQLSARLDTSAWDGAAATPLTLPAPGAAGPFTPAASTKLDW